MCTVINKCEERKKQYKSNYPFGYFYILLVLSYIHMLFMELYAIITMIFVGHVQSDDIL